MNDQGQILVVDDDRNMCELAAAALGQQGFHVDWRERAEPALALLDEREFDVVVTDVRLPTIDGLQLCQRVVNERPETPVVMMTAFGSLETAVAAMRVGAYDFVTKPLEMDSLVFMLRRALHFRRQNREIRRLQERAVEQSFGEIVGESPAIRRVCSLIGRVTDGDATVLITGESGTGKELVARAIHGWSPRREGPFVAVNCAAVPANLLESELFGHTRGAFTDAKRAREGLFCQASDGTLFLDEIGEMPLEMQPKLLRALDEGVVRPVGSDTAVPFDTRIIAATNRDLEADVEEGRFRGDLFYRVNVVPIAVPPLRDRGDDVLLLAQHFVDRLAEGVNKPVGGISREAAKKLLEYDWPGNVRELQNCIERALTLTRHDKLAVADLPPKIRRHRSVELAFGESPEELITLKELEQRYIARVLRACQGNKTQAARILGLDRRTIYRKLGAGENS